MWLKDLAWLWVPVASGIGLGVVWRMFTLHAEVRALHQRVEGLEADTTAHSSQRAAAYS